MSVPLSSGFQDKESLTRYPLVRTGRFPYNIIIGTITQATRGGTMAQPQPGPTCHECSVRDCPPKCEYAHSQGWGERQFEQGVNDGLALAVGRVTLKCFTTLETITDHDNNGYTRDQLRTILDISYRNGFAYFVGGAISALSPTPRTPGPLNVLWYDVDDQLHLTKVGVLGAVLRDIVTEE